MTRHSGLQKQVLQLYRELLKEAAKKQQPNMTETIRLQFRQEVL